MSLSILVPLLVGAFGTISAVLHTRAVSSRFREQRARRRESTRRMEGVRPNVQRNCGLVVFYREDRFKGSLTEYDICDNGVRIGVSRSGTWFFENAARGRHLYSGKIGKAGSLDVDVKVGETYFIHPIRNEASPEARNRERGRCPGCAGRTRVQEAATARQVGLINATANRATNRRRASPARSAGQPNPRADRGNS